MPCCRYSRCCNHQASLLWLCDARKIPFQFLPPHYEDLCHVCTCHPRHFPSAAKPSWKLGKKCSGTFSFHLNSSQTAIEIIGMCVLRTVWCHPIEDTTTTTQTAKWSKFWEMTRHWKQMEYRSFTSHRNRELFGFVAFLPLHFYDCCLLLEL